MLDVNEFYRTAVFNVTRCPHCRTKFRVSAQRDPRRISQRLFEGKVACCPTCHKNFVIRLIPDEAETRRLNREIAAGLERFLRENTTRPAEGPANSPHNWVDDVRGGAPKTSPLPPNRSLVPIHPAAKPPVSTEKPQILVNSVKTNFDCWSSYNPQRSSVSQPGVCAAIEKSQPQFSWPVWGCATLLLGLILYVPCALILMGIFGRDVACSLGLMTGMLLAGWRCYRSGMEAPVRKASRARAKKVQYANQPAPGSESWLSRKLREKAEFNAQHPELSYQAYLAERGMGNMSTPGLLVVGWLATKYLGTIPCIADYHLWRAEKQGKMKKSTGWAIRLALIDWSRTHRKRQEDDDRMRQQATYVADAIKGKNSRM